MSSAGLFLLKQTGEDIHNQGEALFRIAWQVCSLRFVSAKGFSPEYRNQLGARVLY